LLTEQRCRQPQEEIVSPKYSSCELILELSPPGPPPVQAAGLVLQGYRHPPLKPAKALGRPTGIIQERQVNSNGPGKARDASLAGWQSLSLDVALKAPVEKKKANLAIFADNELEVALKWRTEGMTLPKEYIKEAYAAVFSLFN